jgi:hypothetical protein
MDRSAFGPIAAMAALLLLSCSSGGNPLGGQDAALACVGGGSLGPCCGHVAKLVTGSSLPDSSIAVPVNSPGAAPSSSFSSGICGGKPTYSLCNGIELECELVCALPPGYTVLAAGEKQDCPDAGGAAIDAPAPSSRPVPFDAGKLDLGPCSGAVVALIPAAACPDHCPGSLAYAVCDGGAYDECACDIPGGYVLVALGEGGTLDAPSTDAKPTDAARDSAAAARDAHAARDAADGGG